MLLMTGAHHMEGVHSTVENLVWLRHASQQNKPDDVSIYRLRAFWCSQTSLRGDPGFRSLARDQS
jgi:hypothetical protein